MACSCYACDDCKGTGTVWIASDGTYLGNARCDDLDEIAHCDECGGSGISDKCDECLQAEVDAEDMQEFMAN